MRDKERRDEKRARKGERGQCDIDNWGSKVKGILEVCFFFFFNNSGNFSVNLKLFQNKF